MLFLIFMGLVGGLLWWDHHLRRTAPAYGEGETWSEACAWSLIYVGASFVFAFFVWALDGGAAAQSFLSGYVLEKALSVDNLLVFGAVFAYFGIEQAFQRTILYCGIVGAIVFRLIFTLFGTTLFAFMNRPMELVFGAVVAWSCLKMMSGGGDEGDIDHNQRWYIKWTKAWLPVTAEMPRRVSAHRFFIGNKATPILLCAVAIEITDVMFSFDSVPAVISVVRDPFLVYASMIFAILGLRSLYFVLEGLKKYLVHLGKAVTVVLAFVSTKLLLHALTGLEIDPLISLGVILGCLGAGVLASMPWEPKGDSAAH